MSEPASRNLGEQPLATVLRARGLTAHDLVAASPEPITHKMVARACKGRWLTPRAREKVRQALAAAAGRPFAPGELFNYGASGFVGGFFIAERDAFDSGAGSPIGDRRR